ncbi:MAG TPA: histidine phosphatase family protein [Rudaea sp.]|jgi:broad specificity phosphatase PhoE
MSAASLNTQASAASGTSRAGPSRRAHLIRHAQASWGSADYDRLSSLGETQARHLGEWLAADAVTVYKHVVRGDMRRHAQTLDAIAAAFAAAGRELPAARIDAGWNEFDHVPILAAYAAAHGGDENLRAAQTGDERAQRAVLAAAVRAWHEGQLDGAVAETWADFGRRIASARERVGCALGSVLIVTSGGAMWRCAQAALDLDDAGLVKLGMTLRNTGISEFVYGSDRWQMLSWNELPHLAEPALQTLHTHY